MIRCGGNFTHRGAKENIVWKFRAHATVCRFALLQYPIEMRAESFVATLDDTHAAYVNVIRSAAPSLESIVMVCYDSSGNVLAGKEYK